MPKDPQLLIFGEKFVILGTTGQIDLGKCNVNIFTFKIQFGKAIWLMNVFAIEYLLIASITPSTNLT